MRFGPAMNRRAKSRRSLRELAIVLEGCSLSTTNCYWVGHMIWLGYTINQSFDNNLSPKGALT
jgi:hypothetical protein